MVLPVGDGGKIRFGLPAGQLVLLTQSYGKQAEKFAARNIAEAHIVAGRRHQLSVVECEAPMGEMPIEHGKADLRCIGLAGKLRFGGEGAADCHSVASTGKLAALIPDFEGMSVAGIMEVGVRAHDFRRDPCQVPAAFALTGAGGNDAFKIAIKGHRVVILPNLAAEPFRESGFLDKGSKQ